MASLHCYISSSNGTGGIENSQRQSNAPELINIKLKTVMTSLTLPFTV